MARATASEESRRPALRGRLLLSLVTVLGIGSAAVATAAVLDQSEDVPTLREGATLGYRDLRTNGPITCPDGSPLTYTPPPQVTPAGQTERGGPTCADGSVPAIYTEQLEDYNAWLEKQGFGASLADGPVFSYELAP